MRKLRSKEVGAQRQRKLNLPIRIGLFLVLATALALPSVLRWDSLSFIHFWPLILWTPVIILPFVTLQPKAVWKAALLCLMGWLILAGLLKEPGFGNMRPASAKSPGVLRIVVLNCAGGDEGAIREALAVDADLWLLQETTGPASMQKILSPLDPSLQLVADYDACIIARRGLSKAPKQGNSAVGEFLWGGQKLRVVSLRLQPPTFRLDWWSAECRNAYAEDIVARRVQLKEILTGARLPGTTPALVGGDFNSTNRPAFAALMPGWREADWAAGRGWPGTGTNDFPLARVDQLWSSPDIAVVQAFVRKTQHSDHRMVIVDLRPAGS